MGLYTLSYRSVYLRVLLLRQKELEFMNVGQARQFHGENVKVMPPTQAAHILDLAAGYLVPGWQSSGYNPSLGFDAKWS